MTILSINTQTTGLVGPQVRPHRCSMITTDDLGTITAPGYLANENKFGVPIENTQVFDVIYSFNQQTQQGIYGNFIVVVNDGVLVLQSAPSNSTFDGPVIFNNPVTFNVANNYNEGTNGNAGIVEMAEGGAFVPNTSITANSRILLTIQDPNGGTFGALAVTNKTPGSGFDIVSTSNSDSSIIYYQISEPA